jgi:hypothetical protein
MSFPPAPPTFGPYLNDLESPGALLQAAATVARTVGSHREVILMATGPDMTSVEMTNNSLVSLARLGLRPHVLLLADSLETCESRLYAPNCYWSSRMLRAQPSDSLLNRQFWKGWCAVLPHLTPPPLSAPWHKACADLDVRAAGDSHSTTSRRSTLPSWWLEASPCFRSTPTPSGTTTPS